MFGFTNTHSRNLVKHSSSTSDVQFNQIHGLTLDYLNLFLHIEIRYCLIYYTVSCLVAWYYILA